MKTELPHIILIIMDSVSAKRCSVYGHERQTTPGLARIAAEGVLYRYCFAPASWTLPSHTSLFTGLYPGQHGCNSPQEFIYPGNYYTLPEILRETGYHTVGISSNLAISRECSFNWGFDEYYDMNTLFNCARYSQMRQSIKSYRNVIKNDFDEVKLIFKSSFEQNYYSYPFKHLLDRIYRRLWGNIISKSYYATERSLHLAKRLIKRYRERPIFLFINFMETHAQYNPPRRYKKKVQGMGNRDHLRKLLYEQELAYLDSRLLNLYEFLSRLGLRDDTLFIVTSDHGEGFGEHEVWGHVFSVYNELAHIPLIVKYPAALGLRGESEKLVQLHDLFATLLEVAGVPLPPPESSQSLLGPGRDLALVENLDTSFKQAGYGNSPPPAHSQACLALIDGQLHKLIEWADGRLELYDLKKDYGETTNLVASPAYQGRAAFLKNRLAELSVPLGKGVGLKPPASGNEQGK